MTYEFVSVIIPVYNDPDRLKLCLESLSAQTYLNSNYEIIVVDNCSDVSLENITSNFANVILTQEKQVGSYAARNKGICLAKGEIIAFTDSDCIPNADWIEKGVEQIKKIGHYGLVGGKIELFFKNPNRPTSVELYEKINAFPQQVSIQKKKFSVTANLFTTRNTLKEVGTFNSNLKSGGDQQWGNRVNDKGYLLQYGEDVIVRHPARYSYKNMYNRVSRVVGGYWQIKKEKAQEGDTCIFQELKNILVGFFPPVRLVNKLFFDERYTMLSASDKFRYWQVEYFIKIVKAYTTLQLLMGKDVTR